MKVTLTCTYYNDKKEKQGEYGDVLDLPESEAQRLLQGGSAMEGEPRKEASEG